MSKTTSTKEYPSIHIEVYCYCPQNRPCFSRYVLCLLVLATKTCLLLTLGLQSTCTVKTSPALIKYTYCYQIFNFQNIHFKDIQFKMRNFLESGLRGTKKTNKSSVLGLKVKGWGKVSVMVVPANNPPSLVNIHIFFKFQFIKK